jgi:hypothetical protein
VGGNQVGTCLLIERAGEDDDLCLGLGEEPDLGGSLGTASDNDDPPPGDLVEGGEDGELAGVGGHRSLPLPARGKYPRAERFFLWARFSDRARKARR